MQYANGRDWGTARIEAKRTQIPELVSLIEWRYLLDQDSGASYDEIIRFIDEHPNWPYISTLQQRAERALPGSTVDSDQLIARYHDNDPITGIGKIMLADALMQRDGVNERVGKLVHEGWIHGDFYKDEEQNIRRRYDNLLSREHDIARTDRLLWEKQTAAAARMKQRLPADWQALMDARAALINNDGKASRLLSSVPQKLMNEPGLIFDRIRYKDKRGDDEGVQQLLANAPNDAPYPEKWWTYRHKQAREAIKRGHYKTAASFIKGYDGLENADLSEALWLDGWLALEFNGRPEYAMKAFSRMYETVSYPVSLARAAYWAGRAAETLNNRNEADAWYQKAATHPTTYYGQLAALQLDGGAVLKLPADSDHGGTPQNLLERAIQLCIQAGEYDIAAQMLAHAIAQAANDDEIGRLTHMGQHEGVPHLSVRGSKKALQRHLICTRAGYPLHQMSATLPIERALMHAIIRQESEFDRSAVSPAGARGMMQLMPGTARDTARKVDLPYSHSRLETVDYNITLGSSYLGLMIDSYGGSYVLGIAAYNAGPGNVNKWIRQFGRPGRSANDVINWIERIPFSETRNYVQRVLENLQVYRRLENENSIELRQDLVR
ncbi:MAG: transglycosylase SLT domain-containing protein [Alphaproteobacteria bacterium]